MPGTLDDVTIYPRPMALLSCFDALTLVREKMLTLEGRLPRERVGLAAAHRRVLAQTVTADRDQPPFPRSTRDGYAVRAQDLTGGLRLIGGIRAGEQWTGDPLGTAQAIEIMTGAPLPDGADAVVMVEHASLTDGVLRLQPGRAVAPGENIVPRGAEARANDVLLPPGTRMAAAEIALAASVGAAHVDVFRKPVAAIVATGDELVSVDAVPGPMQIRNSNAHALAALVEANGGTPLVPPPAADTRESLHAAILAARPAEMLLLTGGVSAGKYDLVEEVLLALGAEFFFTGVAMQPGKPAVFGRFPPAGPHGEQWIFGLPGNPVSTQVTAILFAMPLLRALGGEGSGGDAGRRPPPPYFAQATLSEEVKVKPGLTRFLPAVLSSGLDGATVRTIGWQGSGDLHANARADCYLVVAPDAEVLRSGEVVTILLR